MDKNFQDWFEEIPVENKEKQGKNPSFKPPMWLKTSGGVVVLVVLALIGLFIFRPFITVDADEVGVVLRLGQYNRTIGPGLNYRLPPPIEIVYLPKVTHVKRVEIGFRSTPGSSPSQQVPEESYMLTGDENVAVVKIAVQFRIDEPVEFLFNSDDVEDTIKDIAESAMRQVVGDYPIDAVLTDRRDMIAALIKESIQEISEHYELGVSINQVQLQGTEVPPEVQPAFRRVVSAREKQIQFVNEAEGYRNQMIPQAEGKVQQMLQEAEGYRAQRVAEAQGEVERFAAVLEEYEAAPEVTKARLYYETMEKVLAGKPKVIMGSGSDNDLLKFLNVSPPGGAQASPPPIVPQRTPNQGQGGQ